MNSRRISWEIVVAGLFFTGLAIYLLGRDTNGNSSHPEHAEYRRHARTPAAPPMPSSIVIDLKNLESLQNLENLKNLNNLENLENLKVRLENLDSIISEKNVEVVEQQALEQSLKQLEQELRKIENADFNVRLQNSKVYIDKDYKVKEAAWSEVSPGVYVYQEPLSTSGLQSMNLDIAYGNLNITGVDTGEGEFVIRATGDISSAGKLQDRLEISRSVQGGEATLSVNSRSGSRSSDGVNLETTLTIPKNIAIEANTGGGHIHVINMDGSKEFVTAGGHITLDNLSGATVAKTSGGHITCDEVTGDLSLSSSGGHIRVAGANGRVNAQTGGGNISITDLNGSAEAKTAGGNISAGVLEADGPLDLSTSAGNITVTLPQTIAANLKAKGSNVTLSGAFDFEGSKTNSNISGTINGGGVPITLNCGFGNVTIKDEQ